MLMLLYGGVMRFLKATSLILILEFVMMSLVGCATYTPEMSREDRIIARYEQNFVLDNNDADATAKLFKRCVRDAFTLGIAEAWYGRARRSYNKLMADRESFDSLRKALLGKNESEIIVYLGSPDKKHVTPQQTIWSYLKRTYRFSGNTFVSTYGVNNGLVFGSGHTVGNTEERISELLVCFTNGVCTEVVRQNR